MIFGRLIGIKWCNSVIESLVACGCPGLFVFLLLLLSWSRKKNETRGRAVVGDPLAFLTVVMKNYYETIITYSSFVFIFQSVGF